MTKKEIQLEGIGVAIFHKRRGTRNIRLSVGHDGTLRVTLPSWTPYKTAVSFVMSKSHWIAEQKLDKKQHVLIDGARIGKAHHIRFIREDRTTTTTRVTNTELIVRLPEHAEPNSKSIQEIIRKGAIRALKHEANSLLPQRLQYLAQKYDFSYKTVSIKHLKARWGSCSSQKDIVLNCFLMQLPWDLIDYVLLHELVHTRILAHGPRFWSELEKYVPDVGTTRRAIKHHQPSIR